MPEPATTNDLIAGQLLGLLPRLHHTLRRDRLRHEAHASSAPSFSDRAGQYRLLTMLLDHDRMTTHQLAERMDVSAPTVSTMVRSLAEQGMVARERDRSDQRVIWLAITDAGRAVVEDERQQWREVFLQRFEQLASGDQRLIVDAIPALERLLETTPCRKER